MKGSICSIPRLSFDHEVESKWPWSFNRGTLINNPELEVNSPPLLRALKDLDLKWSPCFLY